MTYDRRGGGQSGTSGADPLGWGMALSDTPSPLVAPSARAWDTANRAYYKRLINGKTGGTGVRLVVITQSGNISVAVYRNTGAGIAAAPGTLLAASGAVACPAPGAATVALGATIDVLPGDWVAMSCDNTTASFYSNFAGFAQQVDAAGMGGLKAASHPISGDSPAITTGWVGAIRLAVV